jgi:alpha-tubulin suppressor-like RCC1 family protein
VSTGLRHSLAVKTDGTLWAWGSGNSGGLGLNDTADRSSPTQVGVLTDWAGVAAGIYHSLAVKTDGTLWAWGENHTGSLGLNDQGTDRSSPTQVGALTDWRSIAASVSVPSLGAQSFAIKTDGTLWSWGRNQATLGHNDTTDRSSPTQVGALTTWVSVTNGGWSTLAIKRP